METQSLRTDVLAQGPFVIMSWQSLRFSHLPEYQSLLLVQPSLALPVMTT